MRCELLASEDSEVLVNCSTGLASSVRRPSTSGALNPAGALLWELLNLLCLTPESGPSVTLHGPTQNITDKQGPSEIRYL